MPHSTYFVQECPTCGRRLQVRVEYLGRQVACQHCQAVFEAADLSGRRDDHGGEQSALLRRANELLESVAQGESQRRQSQRVG